MSKKVHLTIITLLSLSLMVYVLFGGRLSIENEIKSRNDNKEPKYSRLIVDKISEGQTILSITDENKVQDVLFYIGRHYITPTDKELAIDSNTYSLNFYCDKIDEGMTVTIDNNGFVEIYTISNNKSELNNYKIIENTINIEKIKRLCS